MQHAPIWLIIMDVIVMINGSMEAHLLPIVHSMLVPVVHVIECIWVCLMAVQPMVLVHVLQDSG